MGDLELADLDLAIADSIFDVDARQWDICAGSNPWVRHGFFRALELSGCFGEGRGVVPRYVMLKERSGDVIACAPTVLKWGNKREFGPEIGWLAAGIATGCFSWPKYQADTPFFPRMAPKLLTRPDRDGSPLRAELLRVLYRLGARPDGRSAFSLMHIPPDMAAECASRGALISREIRSVWHTSGVGSFEEYVSRAPARRRRKWLGERRQVAELGLEFAVVGGAEASDGLIEQFYAGFRAVCERHGNQPWIPAETFRQLCIQLPDSVRLMTAFDGDRYVAGSFFLAGGDVLYFDSWSQPGDRLPALVFEMACYRPIEYAIANGLRTVDAGLFAGYKSMRGFVAEPVLNAHWFYNERLAGLARDALQNCSE